MTPDTRAEIESRADRCLRRGEIAEAVSLLEGLVAEFPEDEGLAARLGRVRESLQPMELHHPKARTEPTNAVRAPLSPEQEGERLFASGDYVGAAAAYRRALKDRPDNELLQERLVEIFQLAQSVAPRGEGAGARPRLRTTAPLARGGPRGAARARSPSAAADGAT